MAKAVLSIAAHGDDAEFKAGGTLAQMAAQGHDVYLAIATDNDRGSMRLSAEGLKALARPEAEAAAAALGAKEVFMLGYTDGDLCDVTPSVLRGQIMHLIRRLKADVIFSWDPFAPFEDHPDHRAMAWAASDAAAFAHFPLFHPEQLDEGLPLHRVTEWYWYSKADWQTNKLVDISETMEAKLQALYAYDCQMVLTLDEFLGEAHAAGVAEEKLAFINPLDYKPWVEIGLRAVHGKLGREIGVAYAEAFRYEQVQIPELFRFETGN
jgi:LmbE family N-acetylglucosaminyl deacetylase